MRLLALTGVVLVALVGAGSAQALTEPQSTLLRSLSQAELKALIQDIDAQGLQTNGSANVKTGTTRMQMAAGRIASLRTLGTVTMAATGAVVVWRIADSLGVGGYVYKKITGQSMSSFSTMTNPRWQCVGSSPCPVAALTTATTNVVTSASITCSGITGANGETCVAAQAMGEVAWHPLGEASTTSTSTGWRFRSDQQDSPFGNHPVRGTVTHYVLRTDAQMRAALTYAPSDAAEFASPPAGATTATAGTNDTSTPTDLELEAALDEIDPNPGTAGTAVEQETAEAILDELSPGWAEGELLQPLPNETYTQYIIRLQDAGWVGTATTTVLATEQAGYGPEAVVRVIATPVGGTSTVYDPLNWPSPGPSIAIDADITIRYNPDTAPEAPTTATPTPITGAPTTIPSAPAVDFSPLTDIDFGCKFPYGFVCYAVDFTEQFDVAADAPVFSFTLGWEGEVNGQTEGGEAPYTVDLEVMDDYMALWRGILTVVLWVGAIYLVATRMLGVKFGGDPGEAIDDVL